MRVLLQAPGCVALNRRRACRAASEVCGFTLIELIVVVAILAILATGLLPLAELASQRSKEQDLRAALRDVRTAIDAYKQATDEGRVARKADESGYPPSLELLASGVPNEKDPDKKKIYFLRRIPRDPFSTEPELPPEKTWGLRSYESAPEEPRDGKDVYDIYSKSSKAGLNGVPYKKW
jgi:general secretion pathway protein G